MKRKRFVAVLISRLPKSCIRTLAYRWIFKYDIVETTIGFGTVIVIENARIFGSRIGGHNVLFGVGSVVTKKFGVDNAVIGGSPTAILKKSYDWKTRGQIVEPQTSEERLFSGLSMGMSN